MSKIFLSYKKDVDSRRASIVRTKLSELGVDTFQDVDMSAGTYFHGRLRDEVEASIAVLVLWSKSSMESQWVISEAQHGLDSRKLVAATFDGVVPRDLVMPFNGVHTPDLSDWIETGAKADHAGWKSVLKALGVLCKRPLAEIAAVMETGDAKAKADFVRSHPDDPFAVGLVEQLRATKLREFEQQFARARNNAEKRLSDEKKKLEQLRPEFAKLLDTAMRSGALDALDTRQVIEGTFNNPPEAEQGAGNRKKITALEVARLRSELDLLRGARAAAEEAKVQQTEQLETAKRKLEALGQSQALIWHKDARAWFVVVVVALLAGLTGLFGGASGPSDAEKKIADQLTGARQQLSAALDRNKVTEEALAQSKKDMDAAAAKLGDLSRQNDALAKENKSLAAQSTATTRTSDLNDTLSRENKSLKDVLSQTKLELAAATTKSGDLGRQNDALVKENKSLALGDGAAKKIQDTLTQTRNDLDSANARLKELGSERDTLSSENKRLKASDDALVRTRNDLDSANARLKTLSGERDTALGKVTQLTAQLTTAQNDAAKYSGTAADLDTRLKAANAQLASLSQQPVAGTALQNAESVRVAREAKCNELAAYSTDGDLPSSAKRPAPNQSLKLFKDAIIENCLGSLSTLPKESTRRILVQLARGYLLEGFSARSNNQLPAMTNAYSTAAGLAGFASQLGSAQADVMLGYILGGKLNTSQYTFPGSPNYPMAWSRYEASANAKNPYGLVYAGSYLVWPACSQNAAPSDPDRGIRLIREAQAKNIAEAFYAEGYYWHFGIPGVRGDPSFARKFFERASQLGYEDALKSPPRDNCPKGIF